MNEGPVRIAALKIAFEGPQFGGAAVVHRLALRAFGPAAELGQEAYGHAGQVAHHLGLFQVGAWRVQEFDGLRASLGLAFCDLGVEAGHQVGGQEVAQGVAIARGEGAHDHLIGSLGAAQEARQVKGAVPGLHRRQARQGHACGDLTGLRLLALQPFGGGVGAGQGVGGRVFLRLTAHPAAQHRIELEQHDGREACKNDQLEDRQKSIASMGTRG